MKTVPSLASKNNVSDPKYLQDRSKTMELYKGQKNTLDL